MSTNAIAGSCRGNRKRNDAPDRSGGVVEGHAAAAVTAIVMMR
jgi:hypothetical protein